MSRFQGRWVDDISLWSNYIDVPIDADEGFWSRVVCPNPEHNTTKRHFQVNAQDGLVHCFTYCGISGTYAHAIRVIEGCDDRQARKIILRHAGRRKRHVDQFRASRPVENTRVVSLAYESFIPQAGLEYLERRGIHSESIVKWDIGWCSESLRLVIPVKDIRGRTRFLVKRAVRENQWPKYLYSEGFAKNRLLFGGFDISAMGDMLVVVEGSIDAIRISQHGIPVVATLGTGISIEQARTLDKLRPSRVLLMLDRDPAGIQGIEIAEKRIRKIPLFVCRYPRGKNDPAELTREEAIRSISTAIPLRKFHQRVRNQSVRRLITYGQ